MTPCTQRGGRAVGVNAMPIGARNLVEGILIQLKFAISQRVNTQIKSYNHNLQNVGFNLI